MSVREVDVAFKRLPGLDPAKIPTEATEMGRPAEPQMQIVPGRPAEGTAGRCQAGSMQQPPKVVVFCLDWSASMMSRDTKTPQSRFEICVGRVRRLLKDQVRDSDLVGVVGFGPNVQTVVPLTTKGQGGVGLESRIASLRPQAAGGTCFFDAVATCLQLLGQPNSAAPNAQRWLICLTDGDDLGSRANNARGELVTQMLGNCPPAHLNTVFITVGALQAINMQIIDSWVDRVHKGGGFGRLLAEKDAASISKAFDVVAECLAAEVGGATEC